MLDFTNTCIFFTFIGNNCFMVEIQIIALVSNLIIRSIADARDVDGP